LRIRIVLTGFAFNWGSAQKIETGDDVELEARAELGVVVVVVDPPQPVTATARQAQMIAAAPALPSHRRGRA
jgi:hypothetical protein